jgi:hypothetical protein
VTPRPKGEPVGRRRTAKKNAAKAKKAQIEREAALYRASYRCEFDDGLRCSERTGLHCHHIKRRSQGGRDEADNYLVCCSSHHQLIHDHPEWSRTKGYLT